MNGYVSLEMARRLKEAGVEIETGRYWKVWSGANIQPTLCSVSEYKIDTDPYHPDADPDVLCGKALYLPAPSMAELWEWLPEAINGTDCFYVLQMKKARTHTKVGYIWEPGEEIMATIDDPNPTDALGELALWMVENKKKERK